MPAKKKKLSISNDKIIFTAILVLIISVSIYNLAILFSPREAKVVYAYQEEPRSNQLISFWNTFLEKNPEYLPGWLELAKLEIENDNFAKAFLATNQALEIDPNSELVKTMLEELNQLK